MKIRKAPQPGPSPTTSCKENDVRVVKKVKTPRRRSYGTGGRKGRKGNLTNQLKAAPAPVMKPLLRQTKLVNCRTISVSRVEDDHEPGVDSKGKRGGIKRLSNQSSGGSPKKRSSITKKCSEGSMDIRNFLTPSKDQGQRPSTSPPPEVIAASTMPGAKGMPTGENNKKKEDEEGICKWTERRKLAPKRSINKLVGEDGDGVSKSGNAPSSPKEEGKRTLRNRKNSSIPPPTSTTAEVSNDEGSEEGGKLTVRNNPEDAAVADQSTNLNAVPSSPDSDSEMAEGEFEVETIEDFWDKDEGGVPSYLVKWKGYSPEYDTWEPAGNLDGCDEKIKAFFLRRLDEIKKAKRAAGNCGEKLCELLSQLPIPMDPRPLEEQATHFLTMLSIKLKETEIKEAYKLYKTNKLDKWTPEKLKECFHQAILCQLSDSLTLETRQQVALLEGESRSAELKLKLKKSEEEINAITQGKPAITIENDVDLEGYPEDLTFVNNSVAAEGVFVPNDPFMGCACKKSCGSRKNQEACADSHLNEQMHYNRQKRLTDVTSKDAIFECNRRCECGPNCINRVVQDGTVSLEGAKYHIFRTKNDCGWAVRTLKPIKEGTFVTLYAGEVIRTEEAEKRGKKYDKEGVTYLFDLDYNNDSNNDNNPYTIDAKYFGNISHFINHSCEPNLRVRMVFVDCVDVELPLLSLFATRNIKANEELSFDYLFSEENKKKKKLKLMTCRCGTRSCRNKIF